MAATDEPDGCAQASESARPGVYPRHDFDSIDVVTGRIEHLITREAATWEVQFDAGPGQVVSVADAARVVAHELLEDARFNERRISELVAYPLRALLAGSPLAADGQVAVDVLDASEHVVWNGQRWAVESEGADRVTAERLRHLDVEGYSPEHDDRFVHGELAAAAMVYLDEEASVAEWPWAGEWPKRTGDRVRDLEKAGALIAAEIDRLLRAARSSAPAGEV